MAKNLIPEICKMLGVELGEEFKIDRDDRTYWLDLDGLHSGECVAEDEDDAMLHDLLCGEVEIVKLPWKPNPGEYYYTYNSLWEIINVSWRDDLYDLCWQKLELVFRTEEEALKERSRIYKEWTGEEWEE